MIIRWLCSERAQLIQGYEIICGRSFYNYILKGNEQWN